LNKSHAIGAAAGAAAVLLLGAMGFSAYRSHVEADARMEATIAASQQTVKQLQQQDQALREEQAKREAETAQQLASMRAQLASVQTADQIVHWLPTQIPTRQPLDIQLPKATKENPTPAATAKIPQQDLPQLRDYVESCKECTVKLAAAEGDAASKEKRLGVLQKQLEAIERERDAAVKAAKGGGFWRRLWTRTKWFVVGAAAGAAVTRALH
jgi:hypothetical protein